MDEGNHTCGNILTNAQLLDQLGDGFGIIIKLRSISLKERNLKYERPRKVGRKRQKGMGGMKGKGRNDGIEGGGGPLASRAFSPLRLRKYVKKQFYNRKRNITSFSLPGVFDQELLGRAKTPLP